VRRLSCAVLIVLAGISGCGGSGSDERAPRPSDPLSRAVLGATITDAADEAAALTASQPGDGVTMVDVLAATDRFATLVERNAGPDIVTTASFDLRRVRVAVRDVGCTACVRRLDRAARTLAEASAGQTPISADAGDASLALDEARTSLTASLTAPLRVRLGRTDDYVDTVHRWLPTLGPDITADHIQQTILYTDVGRCRPCSARLVRELHRIAPGFRIHR
jgi:hypothetical protein